MNPFKWADEFSFYLRRKWNMSHFTVGLVLFLPGQTKATLSAFEVGLWWGVLYTAIVIVLIHICADCARKHNSPANVQAVFYYKPMAVALLMLNLGAVVRELVAGDLVAIVSIAHTASVLLLATHGYRVPYEPDNYNYAPNPV